MTDAMELSILKELYMEDNTDITRKEKLRELVSVKETSKYTMQHKYIFITVPTIVASENKN